MSLNNLNEIISDYKKIKNNIKSMVRDAMCDNSIPLLIRLDVLINSEIIGNSERFKILNRTLDVMSNPYLTDNELEIAYDYLEWLLHYKVFNHLNE